ncbi:hypothetical protein FRC02_004795 [Tulasnella sp. 418]|nr:hypothetical protein FRC02_004795 [Tulasnella sp. 418]
MTSHHVKNNGTAMRDHIEKRASRTSPSGASHKSAGHYQASIVMHTATKIVTGIGLPAGTLGKTFGSLTASLPTNPFKPSFSHQNWCTPQGWSCHFPSIGSTPRLPTSCNECECGVQRGRCSEDRMSVGKTSNLPPWEGVSVAPTDV